jgi:hypothetical protein
MLIARELGSTLTMPLPGVADSKDAVMVAFPGPCAVTTPLLLTVAALFAEELQVTDEVMAFVLPSL